MITKIHDNLPPIELNLFTILDWIILIIIFIFLSWIYYNLFYIKKRKENIIKNKKKKKIKKEIKFNLDDSLLILNKYKNTNDWKNFALEATNILKLILEKKYNQSFLFATRSELLEILKSKNISAINRENLELFFDILDPIKFTKNKTITSEPEKIINILKQTYE